MYVCMYVCMYLYISIHLYINSPIVKIVQKVDSGAPRVEVVWVRKPNALPLVAATDIHSCD